MLQYVVLQKCSKTVENMANKCMLHNVNNFLPEGCLHICIYLWGILNKFMRQTIFKDHWKIQGSPFLYSLIENVPLYRYIRTNVTHCVPLMGRRVVFCDTSQPYFFTANCACDALYVQICGFRNDEKLLFSSY